MTLAVAARGSLSSFLSFGTQIRQATSKIGGAGDSVRSKRSRLFSLSEKQSRQQLSLSHREHGHHHHFSRLRFQHRSSLSRGTDDSESQIDQIEKGLDIDLAEKEVKIRGERTASFDEIYQQNHRNRGQFHRTQYMEDVEEISKED